MKSVCLLVQHVYDSDPRVRRKAEALAAAGYTVDVLALCPPDGRKAYTLDGVKNQFNDLAAAFRNSQTPLGQHHDRALAGAGQFQSHLQSGAVKFLLSPGWMYDCGWDGPYDHSE